MSDKLCMYPQPGGVLVQLIRDNGRGAPELLGSVLFTADQAHDTGAHLIWLAKLAVDTAGVIDPAKHLGA